MNDSKTGWFQTPSGVKQGDVLSPTLFSLYINDLAVEIKNSDVGIHLDNITLGILLYADDIALLAESEDDLQYLLNLLKTWCHRWRLTINQKKTQIIHFRKKGTPRSKNTFLLGTSVLEYTPEYKYLGFCLDEFMTYEAGMKRLSGSAGRALGSVVNKLKICKDLGYATYTHLFEACVSPVLNYAAGIWRYKESKSSDAVQHTAIRYFLGIHKFAPILAAQGDIG